ncbi:MAG TPA: hypothetical protein VHJ55_03615, partial [Casimicrobiaceae bacterium]|nr:hypothetical protein [Casimicrobiaceae bacterium]
QGGELNAVSSSGAASGTSAGRAMSAKNAAPASTHNTHSAQEPETAKFCGIGDPTCESCQ